MLKIIILSVTVGLFFYPLSFTGKEFKKENEISKINQTNLSDLKNVDLGRNTKPGDCSIKDNQITIKAGGADIWGTKDEGFFTYTKILGDFEVSVKIVNLEKTHLYTKAGIMARSDLSEDSKHIFFQIFPDNSPRNKNNGGSEFQYRAEKGAEMEAIYPDIETAGNKFDVNFPNTWIRLKRTNNVFESYFSNDNKTWHLFSTYKQEMPTELMLGLAVTSHDSEKYTTAVFSDLSIKN